MCFFCIWQRNLQRGEWVFAYLALVFLGGRYRLEPILSTEWLENGDSSQLVKVIQLVTDKAFAVTNEVFMIGLAAFLAEKWNSSSKYYISTSIAAARNEAIRFISTYFDKPMKWLLVEPSPFPSIVHMEEIRADAALIARLMMGRSLLWSEFKLFMEEHDADKLELAQRMEAIQLASLQQQVVITGAIRIEQHWPKLSYSCLRCHNRQLRKSEAICFNCGTQCLYCANCLNMGRSRWCELTITGVYSSPLLNRLNEGGRSKKRRNESLYIDGLAGAGAAADLRNDRGRITLDIGNWKRFVDLKSWGLSQAQTAATKQTLDYVSSQLVNLSAYTTDSTNGEVVEQSDSNEHSSVHQNKRRLTYAINLLRDSFQRIKMNSQVIPTYLIWAVTGAGKTEMIFPIIDYVTKLGGRVLIASPRRDVVIELDPRIRKAFPASKVVTLYGGSPERWSYGDIVLSTTHQLMRFNRAFELVIIDEVDAFPYHGDPLLYKVANDSCTSGGVKVLLSATPPRKLQQLASIGRLSHAKVPVRYHGHPLPVPQYVKCLSVKQLLEKRTIPSTLRQSIAVSLQRGAQLFFFVQRIAYTEPFKELLQHSFPDVSIAATSSKDPERAQKVSDFRACTIRILVTTTILERGVTIPRSDVYIFDADGKLFDEASLVQMGGRAGRSADDPKGKVYFIAAELNSAQRRAIKQIKTMNRIAAKEGYLLESYGSSTHNN